MLRTLRTCCERATFWNFHNQIFRLICAHLKDGYLFYQRRPQHQMLCKNKSNFLWLWYSLIKFACAIFVPWFYIGRAYGRFHKCSPLPTMIKMTIVMYFWIILYALEPAQEGLFYVGRTTYFFFATFGARIWIQSRTEFQINRNMVEDNKKNDINITAITPPYVVHLHLRPTKSPNKLPIVDPTMDDIGAVNTSYDEAGNYCNGNLCSQL